MVAKMQKPNLVGVHAFVKVVQEGGLAGASLSLGVPSSTVSRRIARLEADLGSALFYRGGRQLRVTPAGRKLFEETAASIEKVENAFRNSKHELEELKGVVRITSPLDFAQFILVPQLQEFSKEYPEIVFELDATSRFVDIAEEGFDFALRVGSSGGDHDLIARQLGLTKLQIVANRQILEEITTLDDLQKFPIAALGTEPARQTIELVDEYSGDLVRVPITPRFVTSDYSTLAAFVSQGPCIGVIPSFMMKNESMADRARVHFSNYYVPSKRISLIYPSRSQSKRSKILVEYLYHSLKEALSDASILVSKNITGPSEQSHSEC